MEHNEHKNNLQMLFIAELIAQLTPQEMNRVISEIEAILSER